jgi:hypothetical protein
MCLLRPVSVWWVMMEAVSISEMSAYFCDTTWCSIPEDFVPGNVRTWNLTTVQHIFTSLLVQPSLLEVVYCDDRNLMTRRWKVEELLRCWLRLLGIYKNCWFWWHWHTTLFATRISQEWQLICTYELVFIWLGSQGSSVSIVSDYGLDNRATEVWSPAEAKNFSCSVRVQTGSGAHPASYAMGMGGVLSWG